MSLAAMAQANKPELVLATKSLCLSMILGAKDGPKQEDHSLTSLR